MRSAAVLIAVLAACASSAPPVREPCPTPPAAKVVQPVAPSDQDIKQRSHAALDALDRADHEALEPVLDARYIHFEGGRATLRDAELDQLRKRTSKVPYIGKRTWSDESVQINADDALFIGKATEIQGGNDSHGGYRYLGWYTLQWRRDGQAWKLRLLTWQRAAGPRDGWNDIYRNEVGFEKQPNKLLVEVTKDLKRGTALDLAMGQGRNALYLASQGWTVTGIDFAEEGVRIAREEAAKRKLVLTTIIADIDGWDFGKEKWDLITMIYPGSNHDPWIEKAKVGLRRGGTFVLEFFAADPGSYGGGYVPGHLAKLFGDGFVILRDDHTLGRPDWARDHAKLTRFVAKKK